MVQVHVSMIVWVMAAQIVLLSSCSTTTTHVAPVASAESLTRIQAENVGEVLQVDVVAPVAGGADRGHTFASGALVHIGPTDVGIHQRQQGYRFLVPHQSVKKITVTSRTQSMWGGLLTGLAAGALMGAAWGLSQAECPTNSWGCVSFGQRTGAMLAAFTLAIPGAAVGALVGSGVAIRDEYLFGREPDSIGESKREALRQPLRRQFGPRRPVF